MTRLNVLWVALLVSGCFSAPNIKEVGIVPLVENRALPSPMASDLSGTLRSYAIGPYDTLSITVFGVEELSIEEVQTDGGGNLTVPLLGQISASGKTLGELAEIIENGYRGRYVRDPQVTVNLKETVSQVFTIDGQVDKPGLYPAFGNMTLVRAVATAGGLNEFADLEDVVVFRTVGGDRMAGLYNLGAIRAGAYDDPEIYPNDVIIIGNSESRRIFKDILQSAPLLSTPLLILFRRN